MSVFVDTSGFFAVLDARDRWHEAARRFWLQAAARTERLLTSNYVLLETMTLLQRVVNSPATPGAGASRTWRGRTTGV